jgi:hypothetical protein
MTGNDISSSPAALAVLKQLSTNALRDAWRMAQIEATLALLSWRIAARESKRAAHAIYAAALEREALAAHVLASRLATVAR